MHLSGNRANCETVAAVVAEPAHVARVEVEVVGVVRERRALRGRPVVAEAAGVVETLIPTAARRRQEYHTAIAAGESPSVDPI